MSQQRSVASLSSQRINMFLCSLDMEDEHYPHCQIMVRFRLDGEADSIRDELSNRSGVLLLSSSSSSHHTILSTMRFLISFLGLSPSLLGP